MKLINLIGVVLVVANISFAQNTWFNGANIQDGTISFDAFSEETKTSISESPTYIESQRIYVDWRNDTGVENGSVYRPYSTITGAFASVGSATNDAAYTSGVKQVQFILAPGTYTESPTIPFRPFVQIDFGAAKIDGNLSYVVYQHPSELTPLVVLAGSAMRSAHSTDPEGASVGVDGNFDITPHDSISAACSFVRVNLHRIAVMGGVHFNYSSAVSTHYVYYHLYLDYAHVNGIHSFADPARDTGHMVTLFASGWNMGHDGGGPVGQGIGQVTGNIIPYTLHNTYLSVGAEFASKWFGGTSLWHNVTFEPSGTYSATNTQMSVKLDTASYNSWLAATTPESRGEWHVNGGRMTLTDPAAFGPWVSATDTPTGYKPLYVGQLLTVTNAPKKVYHATGTGTNDWTTLWSE
jgi:hypothetical protein